MQACRSNLQQQLQQRLVTKHVLHKGTWTTPKFLEWQGQGQEKPSPWRRSLL
jgi:hypothetical protein